jgi:hypothetical protein
VRWEHSAPIRTERGAPRIDYIGWDIRDAQHHEDAPRLTDEQAAAIRLLEETCRIPELQVCMTFAAGDLQVIDDRVLLHARDEFQDPAEGPGRCLLRLWMRDEAALD